MIRLLQGATILEVFYKRGSTLFNEDVLDFHHIKEQLKQHCSSTIAKELAMHIEPMTDAKTIQENLDETAHAIFVNLARRVAKTLFLHVKPCGTFI